MQGISNYCQYVAKCFTDCASSCIHSCVNDKYTSLWLSIVGFLLFWFAYLLLPCFGGFGNMTVPALAFLGLLPLIGATILFVDLWQVEDAPPIPECTSLVI